MDEDREAAVGIKTLMQALQDGTPLDLAPGEDVDVNQAAGWPVSHRLPARLSVTLF